MHIISRSRLKLFWDKHPAAEASLQCWFLLLQRCRFSNLAELKAVFPSADYAKPFTIFNVGGKNFRVITVIHYNRSKVYIREVFTPKDYDRWNK